MSLSEYCILNNTFYYAYVQLKYFFDNLLKQFVEKNSTLTKLKVIYLLKNNWVMYCTYEVEVRVVIGSFNGSIHMNTSFAYSTTQQSEKRSCSIVFVLPLWNILSITASAFY